MWDVRSGQEALTVHAMVLDGTVRFTPDGQRLVVVDALGLVRSWDATPVAPAVLAGPKK